MLCLWEGTSQVTKDRGDIFFNDQAIQVFTVIFRNVGNHLSNDTASCPRKQEFSRTPLPERQISHFLY